MAIEPISQFFSTLGRYPGNNKQWWVARAGADDPDTGAKSGDFLPKVLDSLYSGNNRAPRGHFILNAFSKDRAAVSGIADIPVVDVGVRPNATCFFSGRVWFGANSTIFYSQILDDKSKAGLCYQEADPTAEDISDLIDSDGGVIPIPEANKITKLVPFDNGVFVFAVNGVWFISGGGSAFSARNIAVDKVSSFGTKNIHSIILVDDTVYWWSEVGIQALQQASGQFGPIPGKFGNTSISEQTVQTYYNNIPDNSKQLAKGIYDPKNNIIQWEWSSDNSNPSIFDRILNFDVTLQAFYPWSISQGVAGSPRVRGIFLDTDILATTSLNTVTTGAGTVTDSLGNSVTVNVTSTTLANRPTNLRYLTTVGTNVTFSKFDDRSFVDWVGFDGVGQSFSSFIETGYELNNDAMRRKQAIYITIFFRRTEDDSQGVPSSCTFRAKWDWASSSNTNKWSQEVEAYRPKKIIEVSTADVTSGMPVVFSKNKVRGSGKAVQFRFGTDTAGRNFDLLGWSVSYVGNTEA